MLILPQWVHNSSRSAESPDTCDSARDGGRNRPHPEHTGEVTSLKSSFFIDIYSFSSAEAHRGDEAQQEPALYKNAFTPTLMADSVKQTREVIVEHSNTRLRSQSLNARMHALLLIHTQRPELAIQTPQNKVLYVPLARFVPLDGDWALGTFISHSDVT